MSPPSPGTVVCVDDDAATRYTIALALRRAGFEVREASTGAEALRLAAEKPDLIILDVNLPDVGGFEVCARIKADPATAAVPVLHLSGVARGADDKAEGLEGGADGYLTKPFESVELIAQAKALVRARRAEQAAREGAERLRLIIQTAYEAFVALDAAGRVVEWNRQAERLFGWSHGEAVGRPLTDLIIPPRFRGRHCEGIARLLAAEAGPEWHVRLEVPALHKEGHEFPAEVKISTLRSGEERLVNAFVRDRTETERAELGRTVRQAVGKALVESATVGEATTKILRVVCEITGWDAAAVWREDRPAGRLRCVEAWSGPGVNAAAFEAVTRERSLAPGSGLPGQVWATGEPAWQSGAEADPRDRVAAAAGLRSALAFPVPFGREVTGVIEFFSRRPLPPDELLSLLGLPSSLIAQYFERKRAEEAQAEGLRLTAFNLAVNVALTRTETLSAMLAGCAEAMVHCLDAALARIWTLDSDAGVLELQASAGLYTHVNGAHSRVPLGSHESGRIAQERVQYWTNDLANDARVPNKDWVRREGLTAFAGYPLLVGGRLVGVTTLFARHPFSDLALKALAAAADSIALGVQRREAEQLLRATEEEFRAARQIQQNLFPRIGPRVPGFDIGGASYPAVTTGGDYYDYFALRDETVGVVIGDVSGHGVGPALLMASVRAYLHALALTHTDPSEILALVNRALAADMEDRFITLILARLDPARRSLVYASAGHPPGYVLDARGERKTKLGSTAMALGVVPDGEFPCSDPLTLEPGEVAVFLTDGVVEARDPDDVVFGVDRALAIVRLYRHEPAATIVENLFHAVRAFARDVPPNDDISAVIIKATAGP